MLLLLALICAILFTLGVIVFTPIRTPIDDENLEFVGLVLVGFLVFFGLAII